MYEAIKELPEDARLQLYDAIFLYSLDFKLPELNGLAKALFIAFEPILTKGNTNYINGSKPKLKRIVSENNTRFLRAFYVLFTTCDGCEI